LIAKEPALREIDMKGKLTTNKEGLETEFKNGTVIHYL